MGRELRHIVLALVLAGSAAVLAAPAEARRSTGTTATTKPEPGYVPAGNPGSSPTTIPVDFPDGGPFFPPGGSGFPQFGPPVGPAPRPGDGAPRAPVPDAPYEPLPLLGEPSAGSRDPAGQPDEQPLRRRNLEDLLSRTGAETTPLARAGLAALALGGGLIVLGRRRRADGTTS